MRREERTNIWKNMSVGDFVNELGGAGFTAKRVYEAVEIYKKMLDDKKCFKVLCIAGSLIAGGMKNVINRTIENHLVDGIVTTGAMLTHDLIEAFGVKHEPGTPYADDIELSKRNIDRIYDTFLPNMGYEVLEKRIQEILSKLPQEALSPRQFLSHLGKHIDDKNSFIRVSAENNIPIFCPAITDSILGFQVWMYSQDHKLKLDSQLDIRDFLNIVWEKERYGAIILGGGVPKHFVAGMMQVSGKSLNYAIQITMDRPEHGGVSGAPLKEAKSWKKVAPDALIVDVICDSTLAFPLIISALLKE